VERHDLVSFEAPGVAQPEELRKLSFRLNFRSLDGDPKQKAVPVGSR
jgi:hypothetical protein